MNKEFINRLNPSERKLAYHPAFKRYYNKLMSRLKSFNNDELKVLCLSFRERYISQANNLKLSQLLVFRTFKCVLKDRKLIDLGRYGHLWEQIYEFKTNPPSEIRKDDHFLIKGDKVIIWTGYFNKPQKRKDILSHGRQPQPSNPSSKKTKTAYGKPDTVDEGDPLGCICNDDSNKQKKILRCKLKDCNKRFHKDCVGWYESFEDFECPSCVLKGIDPLHQVEGVLSHVSYLVNNTIIKFTLTDEQMKMIDNDPLCGIEVRSLFLDEAFYFEQKWPENCKIKINDHTMLNIEIDRNNGRKRKDKRIFTKSNLFAGSNIMRVAQKDSTNSKCEANKSRFLVGVYLIRKIEVEEFTESLISSNVQTIEESKQFLEKIGKLWGVEFQAEEFTVDLNCKLTLCPIYMPVRGIHCKHFQCFSVDSYAKTMQRNGDRAFRCLICKKPCHYLIFDSFFADILFKARSLSEDVDRVTVTKDGQVKFISEDDKPREPIIEQKQIDQESTNKKKKALIKLKDRLKEIATQSSSEDQDEDSEADSSDSYVQAEPGPFIIGDDEEYDRIRERSRSKDNK